MSYAWFNAILILAWGTVMVGLVGLILPALLNLLAWIAILIVLSALGWHTAKGLYKTAPSASPALNALLCAFAFFLAFLAMSALGGGVVATILVAVAAAASPLFLRELV